LASSSGEPVHPCRLQRLDAPRRIVEFTRAPVEERSNSTSRSCGAISPSKDTYSWPFDEAPSLTRHWIFHWCVSAAVQRTIPTAD
jgi:hypothetical protein